MTSTSGRNTMIQDMAIAARERGDRLIGLTSLAYTRSVSSRHASGKKLADLCDIVLDNGAPAGDACVAIEGVDQKTGPLSSVTGCALVNALVAEVIAGLASRGMSPPVFRSANLEGGDEHNASLLEKHRNRIHYLE